MTSHAKGQLYPATGFLSLALFVTLEPQNRFRSLAVLPSVDATYLWFLILDLLQEVIVLLHQLILTLSLSFLKLRTTKSLFLLPTHHPNLVQCLRRSAINYWKVGSSTTAHPLDVLHNLVDVGLVDLNLLPERQVEQVYS